VAPSDVEIEGLVRASEERWFVVPDSDGKRRGVYAHSLRRDVSRRGWTLDEVEDRLASVVLSDGGTARPQKYSTFWDAFLARLLGQASSRRVTTYYELPAEFFAPR
jgi:hypothetical protein